MFKVSKFNSRSELFLFRDMLFSYLEKQLGITLKRNKQIDLFVRFMGYSNQHVARARFGSLPDITSVDRDEAQLAIDLLCDFEYSLVDVCEHLLSFIGKSLSTPIRNEQTLQKLKVHSPFLIVNQDYVSSESQNENGSRVLLVNPSHSVGTCKDGSWFASASEIHGSKLVVWVTKPMLVQRDAKVAYESGIDQVHVITAKSEIESVNTSGFYIVTEKLVSELISHVTAKARLPQDFPVVYYDYCPQWRKVSNPLSHKILTAVLSSKVKGVLRVECYSHVERGIILSQLSAISPICNPYAITDFKLE